MPVKNESSLFYETVGARKLQMQNDELLNTLLALEKSSKDFKSAPALAHRARAAISPPLLTHCGVVAAETELQLIAREKADITERVRAMKRCVRAVAAGRRADTRARRMQDHH